MAGDWGQVATHTHCLPLKPRSQGIKPHPPSPLSGKTLRDLSRFKESYAGPLYGKERGRGGHGARKGEEIFAWYSVSTSCPQETHRARYSLSGQSQCPHLCEDITLIRKALWKHNVLEIMIILGSSG